MSLSIEILISAISAFFAAVSAGAVSLIAWYFKKYVISEIEKNSAARRWLLGDESLDADEGFKDSVCERFDCMEESIDENQSRNEEWLAFLNERITGVVSALRSEGVTIEQPESEGPGFYRGEGGSKADD